MSRTTTLCHCVALAMLALVSTSGWATSDWIELQPGRAGSAPLLDIREVEGGMVVTLDVTGFYADAVDVESTAYTAVTIPETGIKGELGQPAMPFRNVLVPIPNGPHAEISSVVGSPVQSLQELTVIPAQEPIPECGTATPDFVLDDGAYGSDKWFPAEVVHLAGESHVRGQRFLLLEISPLQFNPARRELRGHPRLEVHIAMTGEVDAAAEAIKLRRAKSFFATRIEGDGGANPATELVPDGIEYLIIAHDSFLSAVEPLAEWKRLKGFTVEVVPISVVGASSSQIKTFLQARYDGDPDLTYVLLVGDHQQVPAQNLGGMVSDLYYSCLDGSDYFPDVVMGRISVQNATDCANVVDKILAYDRTPDTGAWHADFLMAAFLQDYNDYNCEADRFFFETGTHVMHYVRDVIGMGIHTAATSDSLSCNPYYWRSDNPSWYPHRPPGYAGQSVPPEDAALITNGSTATQDVTDAINAGVSIVQHRDHGGVTGWGDPHYNNSNINGLSNGSKTPVVFSINCLTGTFDYGSDCFAEAFMKKYPGGAVGVVAATDVSYSGHNDLFAHGTYDCFWDPYDPADGGNIYPHSFRPAEAMNYGKYYMYNWEGAGSTTELEFELFHWHGDPEMYVFTAVPVVPAVTVNGPIPVGATELTVSCNAEGAMVAVTDQGTLVGRGVVSGGVANVTLEDIQSPTTLDVVVTGHNLIPVEESCEVIVPQGPWLVYRSHLLDDSAGNGDGILNPGESVILPVTVENIGVDPASAVTALLGTSSIHGTVTDPNGSFPNIDPGTTAQSVDHFGFQVDGAAPNGHPVGFALDWSADGGFVGSTGFAIPVCEALVISNVQVSDIRNDSAVISWQTNLPATSRVNYGSTTPPTLYEESTSTTTSHEIQIAGLDPCTRYYFEVQSESPGCYLEVDDNGGFYHSLDTLDLLLYLDEALDADPSWTIDNGGNGHGWSFGQPTGAGGEYGNPDPNSGYTGPNVYGVNLSGDYDNYLSNDQLRLESPSLDMSEATFVYLRYWRWLGIEQAIYDHARVQISVDGGGWISFWENTSTIDGGSWVQEEFDLTSFAAGHADVRIRWTLGSTDTAWRYCGWNIDDIVVEGSGPCGGGGLPFGDGFESGDCSVWSEAVEN